MAMTPLTLKGDMMMFPSSSLSSWYSRPPNTWVEEVRVAKVVMVPSAAAPTVLPLATAATSATAVMESSMARLRAGRGRPAGRGWGRGH